MTNIVTIVGTVTRDPEGRTTQGGTNITRLSVVTSRPKRDKEGKSFKDDRGYTVTDDEFHNVTCFNGLGRAVAGNAFKGQKVSVAGRIHYSKYTDNHGVQRYGVEIIADSVDFITYRPRASQPGGAAETQGSQTTPSDFADNLDDDVPF